MSNTECCYKQYHNTPFFRQSEICNRKVIKYCPCLSCECKKRYEPDKCCCTDMGLQFKDLCQLQECDNSEIVKEDNDGLSGYKTDNGDD